MRAVLIPFYADGMVSRCRLCTTNDREALVSELAAELWRNEADGRSLADAGPHWQTIFHDFAERTIATLEGDHRHPS